MRICDLCGEKLNKTNINKIQNTYFNMYGDEVTVQQCEVCTKCYEKVEQYVKKIKMEG